MPGLLERLRSEQRLRRRGAPAQGKDPWDPTTARRRYQQGLRERVEVMERAVRRKVVPLIEQAGQRRDDLTPVQREAIADLRDELARTATAQQTLRLIRRTAREVDELSARDMARILGMDLGELKSQGRRERFEQDNQDLARDLGRQQADEASKVLAAVAGGMAAGAAMQLLERRMGVVRRRADLIADTETSHLKVDLDEERQRDVGITGAFWVSSRDARVRDSHARMDGERFDYDDLPIVDGVRSKPGSPPRCRCKSRPDTSQLRGEDPQAEQARQRRLAEEGRERTRERAKQLLERRRSHIRLPRSGRQVPLSDRQAQADARARAFRQMPNLRRQMSYEERRDAWNWEFVHGANRRIPVAMKQAAREQFGAKGMVRNPRGRRFSRSTVALARKDMARMYDEAQADFRRRGVRHVRLYRGVKRRQRGVNALESWTDDRRVAERFAGPNGHVYVEDVPAEEILMSHQSPRWVNGIWGEQGEYVRIR